MPSLSDLYKKIDDSTSDLSYIRPKIGLSANRKDGVSCIADAYYQSVVMAGGAPVLIPVMTDIQALATIVDSLDGLILSGGGDIHPDFFGEEIIYDSGDIDQYRDEYDFLLLRLALNRQLPIFGICRGHQVINVAFGGTIYQDIYTGYFKKPLKHSQKEARDIATQTVEVANIPSKLFRAIHGGKGSEYKWDSSTGMTYLDVNSFHHQAVKEFAPEFIATAESSDELNEAMEHPEYPIFSVQWHPESMAAAGNETMLDLFRYHISYASIFAKAKKLHEKIVTIDSHTDTPMLFETPDLGRKEGGKVNLPLMYEGRLDAVFMVAFIPQGERDDVSRLKATAYAEERLSKIIEQAEKYSDRVGIAKTQDDLWRLKNQEKKAIFLGIENGYAIGRDLRNIQKFKDMGVSYITLCHNGNNDICDSAAGTAEWGGLSPLGICVVNEMNRLGLVIDVSHAAESTFYSVLKHSSKPVIASHSSARALCDHRRNLDDDQIRALAAHGGVVQVCLYREFIDKNEGASLREAFNHICHIIDIAGIDHVGIGSDFDGDGELVGCRAANELIQITMSLIIEEFDDESIAKIWGGNLLRVLRENENLS